MSNKIRLGIAGLGTVGIGVIKIIQAHGDMLTARSGKTVEVVAISARSRSKDRGIDLSAYAWEDDPVALAKRDDIDVYVELMGGENGPAKASVVAAIAAGKHVVTANKALLARHGQALAEQAEEAGVSLRFEAAVAGGIPVIKTLTEGLAGNRITRVMGVMNGTCNYILTRMESEGLPYEDVFAQAHALGYLEADPALDVGGIDAAHKLTLLSSIAFGIRVNFDGVDVEGIERITIEDIRQASDMGYRIKLLGVSELTDEGLEQRMKPCLVPADSPLGQLEAATNMVVIQGDAVGQIVLRGAGAGEGPTASAVMGDIVDVARGLNIPTFGQAASTLTSPNAAKASHPTAYYLRMTLKDQPGVLAKISAALAKADVSIDRMHQYSHKDIAAPVLIVTHPTKRVDLDQALAAIASSGAALEPPVALRIEEV